MAVARYVLKSLPLTYIVCLTIIFSSKNVLADVSDLLAKGDKARLMGEHSLAEKAYAEALAQEPQNYRILKSLVEVKVILKKYEEAKPLAENILSRKVMLQKKVKVFEVGQSDALKGVISPKTRTPYHMAELVDETVVAADSGKSTCTPSINSGAVTMKITRSTSMTSM